MRISLNSETIIISRFSRQRVSGDTWLGHVSQGMARANACVTHGKPCVHMHANGHAYKMGGQFVEKGRRRKERKRKKKKKRVRKERKKERKGEKKKRKREKRKYAFRRSELIRPRSKVRGLHFKR